MKSAVYKRVDHCVDSHNVFRARIFVVAGCCGGGCCCERKVTARHARKSAQAVILCVLEDSAVQDLDGL